MGFCIIWLDGVPEPEVKPDSKTQRQLKARLKAAREAQKVAMKQFQVILQTLPSGIPEPDCSEQITQASRNVTASHQEIVALLLELHKYSTDGDGKQR